MSLTADIADAIVDHINDAPVLSAQIFDGSSFVAATPSAERTWLPLYELAEMDSIRVTVVPRRHEGVVASRLQIDNEIAIDIGVQKRLVKEGVTNDEIDALVTYAESVRDKIAFVDFTIGATHASFFSASSETLVALDHLEEMRQFTHVLTVTYRVISTP